MYTTDDVIRVLEESVIICNGTQWNKIKIFAKDVHAHIYDAFVIGMYQIFWDTNNPGEGLGWRGGWLGRGWGQRCNKIQVWQQNKSEAIRWKASETTIYKWHNKIKLKQDISETEKCILYKVIGVTWRNSHKKGRDTNGPTSYNDTDRCKWDSHETHS